MTNNENYIQLNKLTWKNVTALSEQAPNLFKLVNLCAYSEKADELEEYFEDQYSKANSDLERKTILRKIENESARFISNKENEKAVCYAERLLNNSYIPVVRHENTFDSFKTPTQILVKAKHQALSYIKDLDKVKNGKNLIIAGYESVGTGKTHLAIAIANEAIKSQIPTIFISSTTMMSKMRKDFDTAPYINTNLLILDDLGKENKTSWVLEQLYLILDSRHNNNKATVITTENSIDYLEKQFGGGGKALISRLCGNFTLIKCTGNDYRLNRKDS